MLQLLGHKKSQQLRVTSKLLTIWSHLSESNGRPTDYKSVALPAELKWHIQLKKVVTPTGIEPMSPP